MPKLKILSGKRLIALFSNFGFVHINTKGSHVHMKYKNIHATIPLHNEIAKGTLKAIYRQASIVVPKAVLDAWFYSE